MLNRTFFIIALSVMPGIYLAAAESKEDNCIKIANMSLVIMENRQKGYSEVDQIKAVRSLLENPKPFEMIIELAYRSPIYETEQMRSMAATDFEDSIWRACHERMDNSKSKNK